MELVTAVIGQEVVRTAVGPVGQVVLTVVYRNSADSSRTSSTDSSRSSADSSRTSSTDSSRSSVDSSRTSSTDSSRSSADMQQ